jgi:ATP-binding cassette subfamily B protein
VLEGISFKINKGETFAILGATGSGKSTLVNLIPRFYDVTHGEILVDGVNVKDYSLSELHERVGIVLQKAELYSRSIEANIAWGKKGSTPWEIKTAAEIAQADNFICSKENGYYTQVTEGGHSLSGGQKQRVSVARAVLKDSEILIFDDSTSALDLSTEAKLYKALDNLEALISHNEADVSTWIPLEYEENLTYGQKNCEWSAWTKELRELVKQDSIDKINNSK